jgi:hypothetical protein
VGNFVVVSVCLLHSGFHLAEDGIGAWRIDRGDGFSIYVVNVVSPFERWRLRWENGFLGNSVAGRDRIDERETSRYVELRNVQRLWHKVVTK